ncbi:glycine cleavage T protein (aminomethyl transferase) [Arthrobacter crystallopoietes BAB-32]|uniref:Glycine cleavage T protein (Aminomethyl transferase) n=1 Tax=Arthrobacter crystallopoietes BAB-32 TaxID=1246476 RepID=N1V0W9_9MICC|nr:glycine cleavage T protein (aminomethyl transferase) [Arthrobacter crystallopoietes BAB-32]
MSRPGAVEASQPDAGVAAHYGDPLREQRLLAGGTAVVDLSHRGVVTVAGEDRLNLLNTLSSQLLLDLKPGQSRETLLLTLQGRIEYDARIIDDGDTSWLIVESFEAEGLAAWLTSMKFMMRVEAVDATDRWAVVGAAAAQPGFEGRLGWQDPWPEIGAGGYAYTGIDEPEHPGRDLTWFEYLVPADELEDTLAGRELAGVWAAEALRIAAWRPRFGLETDEKTIPHELDLLRTAVHLAKGCYKGQETVARVHNLGHPPRRLVFLQLDGSQHTLPDAGSEVRLGERTVGRVTSAAQHYEMGPVALAVVKRSVDPAAQLVVVDGDESYDASQETIVAPDAGKVVGRPTGLLRGPR